MLGLPKQELARLRKIYTPGTTVELVRMDDPYTKIPEGTKGVVKCVDDTGTVHVEWETGSTLGAVYGEDECRVVSQPQKEHER